MALFGKRRASPAQSDVDSTRAGALRRLRPIVALAQWLAAASGLAAAVVRQGVRPTTWRRPVRTEFFRFLDFVSVGNLPTIVVASGLVGFAIITQALFWEEKVGQVEVIDEIVNTIVVREISPLIVGFLALGRSGLVILSEVGTMRNEGQIRMLDARGIDPFLTIVVPRVLALTVGVFSLTIVFIIAAFAIGNVTAMLIGARSYAAYELPVIVLNAVGSMGYATLPIKTLTIGFTIGIVCCLTALEGPTGGDKAHLMSSGFIRCVLAIFLVSGLTSLLL